MEPTAGRRATRLAAPQNTDPSEGDSAVRWVQVGELTDLAKALLGERPSGRDVIPVQVAERVSRLAAQWATHGFTAATVRPWVDLAPADAAVLAARGATPETLERHIVTTGTTTTSLWRAVTSGAMSAADAADAFKPAVDTQAADAQHARTFSASAPQTPGAYKVAPGTARPAAETFKAPPQAPATGEQPAQEASPAKVAPAVFSHPAAETTADTDDRRRRSTPPQTPFST